MTDVQIEIPANGTENPVEAKEEVKAVNDGGSDSNADQSADKTKGKPAQVKKAKYDGRCKKRKWVFDRRDDNVKREKTNPEDRVKRRKYLMVLGYAGANYIGMQRNPDVNTIEEELLKAMLKNKLITEEAFQQPQYTHFQRAARTDKGVSAARQCISLKLPEKIELESLNKDLPSDIKVFGYKRVTKGFNCKDQCNARTYSYILPSVSFASYDQEVDMKAYRLDDSILTRVNETLKLFEGTKNFHNFTSRKKYEDPSAIRFIITFACGPPFMVDDVEFCTITVKGQSFMMHQIRKMIGLTLAVVRGITNVDTITKSFEKTRLDIPMAPGLGLVLDQVHYDGYNARFKDDGMHEQLEWDEIEPTIQEFRDNFIYPVIKDTELKEQPMIQWLKTLPLHSYDERPAQFARNNNANQADGGDNDETAETNESVVDDENGGDDD
ncbi:pseudouridylate synthase 1 homolog [Sitodiplosis mosellana]|uniref:pseudouridylate synthase 1 homolog n=1 Tax=Sitodiplosis mosellana TaxID=263140 RepID=UPI00244526BE|nr:pseudouridylate synthase 1 homolog [Sitodiplosis mosellana]